MKQISEEEEKPFIFVVFKGRWGVRKEAEIQLLSGIVAIEGYLQFEHVVSL
jgi:hypothetical protein